MVYIKDFVQLVSNCVASDIDGGTYNVGNGWQVSLEEQIKGIVEVFSPKDNPSTITYVKDKPDPLENAFDISKTVEELHWIPQYSYLDQLRDFKKEKAVTLSLSRTPLVVKGQAIRSSRRPILPHLRSSSMRVTGFRRPSSRGRPAFFVFIGFWILISGVHIQVHRNGFGS